MGEVELPGARADRPDAGSRTGTPRVDRTLDAYAALDPRAELAVRWRFDLPGEQAKALARLAEALPCLGRADSLCEAALDPAWEPTDRHRLWPPTDVSESVPLAGQATTLLAPTLPLDVKALPARPVDVRAGRLVFAPATRFVGYVAGPAAVVAPPARAVPLPNRTPVEAVRLAVTSRNRPPHTDAVAVADLLRTAALSRLGGLRGQRRASLLAGRDAGGARLTGHRHAHFLALPDEQRRLGELVVWALGGLAADEVAALAGIEVVQPPHAVARPRVTVRVSGYGPARQVLADRAGPAVRWRSVTPFVPARHPKRDWPGFVVAEVRRELSVRGLPAPVRVEARDGDWRSFVRYRPSRLTDTPPDRRGAGRGELLELTFAEPVTGPLALGHLSHFGLGLFRPAPPS